MKKINRSKWAAALTALLLFAGASHGVLLNLDFATYPDLVASYVNVDYDALTDAFIAHGYAQQFMTDTDTYLIGDATPFPATFGDFLLQATIDENGLLGGGNLSISGYLYDSTFTPLPGSGILLTGSLTAFGYDIGSVDTFEFAVTVTGGDLYTLYGGANGLAGVLITADTAAAADPFSSSFAMANADVGQADTKYRVPDGGSTLGMAAMGLTLLGVLRRKRS